MPRIHSGEKTISSINGIVKTGHCHAKEWNWTYSSQQTLKSTQNGLKTYWKKKKKERKKEKVRSETITVLEENMGISALTLVLAMAFFVFDTKNTGNESKNKQVSLSKSKKFLHSKGNNKMKK